MRVQGQAGLFDHDADAEAEREDKAEFTIDLHFSRATRYALDATSWIEVVPGWASGPEGLFEQLANGVPWREHYRQMFGQWFLEPRLTAEYQDFKSIPHPQLLEAARVLSAHYGRAYDSVWLNLYRDGRDSTGWHRDHFSCRQADCIVPVLTLGGARPFLVKPRRGGASIRFVPRSGDLVVMGGRSQEDWLHSVPKVPGTVGRRISVNFQSSEQARK